MYHIYRCNRRHGGVCGLHGITQGRNKAKSHPKCVEKRSLGENRNNTAKSKKRTQDGAHLRRAADSSPATCSAATLSFSSFSLARRRTSAAASASPSFTLSRPCVNLSCSGGMPCFRDKSLNSTVQTSRSKPRESGPIDLKNCKYVTKPWIYSMVIHSRENKRVQVLTHKK